VHRDVAEVVREVLDICSRRILTNRVVKTKKFFVGIAAIEDRRGVHDGGEATDARNELFKF
jgi:hypothetical protein